MPARRSPTPTPGRGERRPTQGERGDPKRWSPPTASGLAARSPRAPTDPRPAAPPAVREITGSMYVDTERGQFIDRSRSPEVTITRRQLETEYARLVRAFGEAQFGRWRSMTDLVDVATAEPLDRARLDELAARHGETQGKVARELAAAVARAHEILRPEQRAKVRELIERAGLWRFAHGRGKPPTEGPYR